MNSLDAKPVIVRLAIPADASALAKCHHACWREAYEGQLSPTFLDSLDDVKRAEWWQHNLSESEELVVIADQGDEIVGFAGAGQSLDDPPLRDVQLHMLYVRQSMHGRGVGQQLFDAVVADQPCSLWVARENGRAISFYRRQGFTEDGSTKAIPEFEDIVTIRMVR